MSFNLKELSNKRQKLEEATASSTPSNSNPFLSQPAVPETALQVFLYQVRNAARRYLPKEQRKQPIRSLFCEVECRLGTLKINNRRVSSSGTKRDPKNNNQPVQAFDCTHHQCGMVSGISRSHFLNTTQSGLSQVSPLSRALKVDQAYIQKECREKKDMTPTRALREALVETSYTETVYTGYSNNGRVCYEGEHPPPSNNKNAPMMIGKMESKEKLVTQDLCLPAANSDVRITLSSEKIMNPSLSTLPPRWTSKRIKRRRSYKRRDKKIQWQIDVTEVTTILASDPSKHTVEFEVETELLGSELLQLLNDTDDASVKKRCTILAAQLWWILSTLNPLHEDVNVEDTLRNHPDSTAVQLALATCGALKQFMESNNQQSYNSPIAQQQPNPQLANTNFVGCMPVNFGRHNIEDIQRSADNCYYLSEKTDGVRYFMIFTGKTVVLVDRAMRGKQPLTKDNAEPFAPLLPLIQAGTVFDGEVVMNRRQGHRPRPVFIVFDVLAISATQPILHLPFAQRLRHLKQATFRTPTANRDMFDARWFLAEHLALPLVRKNFVTRSGLDTLLSKVVEEGGMRCYRDGDLHNHLTDGIIFQPNRPYVCGTDVNLLKWKYLDTVTIDVELMPLRSNDPDDTLRVACLGEEGTRVDMTRYVMLPPSERLRLEADRYETRGKIVIAEVGFDPETGEWYYLTMRGDKIAPNHISTVLGTLLELAESLTTEELRFRMSVPAGHRDTYRKDTKRMLGQLLDFQRKQLAEAAAANGR